METNSSQSRVWKALKLVPVLHSAQTEHFRNRFSSGGGCTVSVKTVEDDLSQTHQERSMVGMGRGQQLSL